MKDNQSKLKKRKFPLWFYAAALAIPLLVFVLLEAGLRAFNYGNDYSTFIKLPDRFADYLFFNPKLPQKYFNNEAAVPSVIPDAFLEKKPENGYRIFVLGGSSAAGFPYPSNVSFPQFLRRKLELLYPQIKFEVINLGVSAVNSIFLRDIIDDVLNQDPDLLLIYAGHNEYYGALGAASKQMPGWLTRLNLNLQNLKTYQLLEEFFSSIFSVLSSGEKEAGSKTLMAAMAGEQLVELNSEKYKAGIAQFESNIDYILSKSREKKVEVILGKLVSNLKQKPLDSILKSESEALKIFNEGEKEFKDENLLIAKKLFQKAKETDALRFRAPAEINSTLSKAAKKYDFPIADVEQIFMRQSNHNITGYSLLVDHLHPNINGYYLTANIFFNKMIDNGLLPKENKLNPYKVDALLKEDFPFTDLDRSFSDINIEILLNSYPFKDDDPRSIVNKIELANYSDSLAMNIVTNKISWENAHLKMAEYFLKRKKFKRFYREMNALIENKPFDKFPYIEAAEKLMAAGQLNIAERVLQKMHRRIPNEYSSKNLGRIKLNNKNFPAAIFFYEEAVKYNTNNPDLFFNLSNAYFFSGKIEKAIKAVKRTIELKPEYPNARKILEGLRKAGSRKAKDGRE